jgi:uncharacterized protein
MEWRKLTVTNVFIGNFFFVAGIGMIVSAQWELALGNSYGYTILSAFGLFYGGFGAIITPLFGTKESYGTMLSDSGSLVSWFFSPPMLRLTIFVTVWAVWNLFFLVGSLPLNLVYIGIFFTVQMAFTLVAASYFAAANGRPDRSVALKKAGGVFAFLSGLLGYYTVGNLMCQEVLSLRFPMGDTSRFFGNKQKE